MKTRSCDMRRHLQKCVTTTNAFEHAKKNTAQSQGVIVHGATVMARMSGCLKRVHNKTPTAGKIQARYLFRIRPLREYKCSSYQDARVLRHITHNKAHRKAFWVLALLTPWTFDFTAAKKCLRPADSIAEAIYVNSTVVFTDTQLQTREPSTRPTPKEEWRRLINQESQAQGLRLNSIPLL